MERFREVYFPQKAGNFWGAMSFLLPFLLSFLPPRLLYACAFSLTPRSLLMHLTLTLGGLRQFEKDTRHGHDQVVGFLEMPLKDLHHIYSPRE